MADPADFKFRNKKLGRMTIAEIKAFLFALGDTECYTTGPKLKKYWMERLKTLVVKRSLFPEKNNTKQGVRTVRSMTVHDRVAQDTADAYKHGAVVDLESDEPAGVADTSLPTSSQGGATITASEYLLFEEVDVILRSGGDTPISVERLKIYRSVKARLGGDVASAPATAATLPQTSTSVAAAQKKKRKSPAVARKKNPKKIRSGRGVGGEQRLTIHVLDRSDKSYFFIVKRSTQMSKVFRAYAQRTSQDLRNLRFLLDGDRLLDGHTPASLELEDRDIIEVHPEEIGDIGVFAQHEDDTCGAKFLNANPLPPQATLPLDCIGKYNKTKQNATFTACRETVLDLSLCKTLKSYADRKHKNCQHLLQVNSNDLKIDLDRASLINLIGEPNVLTLTKLFPGIINEIKIRRCASHGEWIKLHTDHSQLTMQVPLNSDTDYVGGKLVYVNGRDAKITVPSRPAGSYTIHDNKILHGVSRLESGVRYGLFLLGQYA